jgi:flagellin
VAGIGSIQNTALNSLLSTQANLLQTAARLSTGRQITTAADNPSGLAIFTALETQAAGFDQGSMNAQDALNATNVAGGAAQSITGILGNLSTEAIAAGNGLLSPSDQQAIQGQANQQIQQINTIAQGTTFNGVPLLSGEFAGPTGGTNATAAIPNNDLLQSGQNVINAGAGVTVPPGTPGETIQVAVSGGQAQVTLVSSSTGAVTNVGSFGPGAAVSAGGVTFTLGNFTAGDTGTATIQVTPGTAFSAGNSLSVQTGAAQGATTQLNFAGLTAQSLGVSNLSFASTSNAENAMGVVGNALTSVLNAQAQLGAQATSLQNQIGANNIASTNLTASASDIADLNYPSAVQQFNSDALKQLVTLDVLRSANNQAGYLTGLLNAAA